MQKRTALARAIIHNPKVVILDEPTSGIDPATSSVIEDLILGIKEKTKLTFIVITHDIKGAIRLADKIIFMKDGEIIWQGIPEEIKYSENEEIKIFLKRLEFSPK
jgi:phospholipid/cholesterol/gamma-HCH transport system ATP-binding protein